jgi:hydrogenase-1 operon protein HyaF
MTIKAIPIVALGPGSQPADTDGQTLSYIDMPDDMATYQPPEVPEAVASLDAARAAMDWLRQALSVDAAATKPQQANLSNLDADSREVVNQILGEGEVSMTYNGVIRARTQEAVLAGVWRTLYLDQHEQVTHDLLEVADVPLLVRMPDAREPVIHATPQDVPGELMNALPILAELESHLANYRQTGIPHVINLTLLPLSDADVEFLDQHLGRGPIDMLSRAYGKCQIISTRARDVWWVRYYNSMGTLILNTLEVVDVPQVACAAPEDLADSSERLKEILTPYWADGI